MVRVVQREALGEILQQRGVGCFSMTDHRVVRLQGDVDRRDRTLHCASVFRRSERHGNIDGEARHRPSMCGLKVFPVGAMQVAAAAVRTQARHLQSREIARDI